jgi:hypothetical protein
VSEKIFHWCEACDTEAELTSEEGYKLGWDFPPKMGQLGVLSPRTCPNCTIDQTAWFAFIGTNPLTARHLQTLERIKGEQK